MRNLREWRKVVSTEREEGQTERLRERNAQEDGVGSRRPEAGASPVSAPCREGSCPGELLGEVRHT